MSATYNQRGDVCNSNGGVFAYADPPYPGQSAKHYSDHPDFAGEVDHDALLADLDLYEGWCLHTSSVALPQILAICTRHGIDGYRVASWVKPFAAFKRNVPVAYAWEPVIIKAIRKPVVSKRCVLRDWIAEPITMRRGLAGAKPSNVVEWVLELAGVNPCDDVADLFPGTGAVTMAWKAWQRKVKLSSGEPLTLYADNQPVGVSDLDQ